MNCIHKESSEIMKIEKQQTGGIIFFQTQKLDELNDFYISFFTNGYKNVIHRAESAYEIIVPQSIPNLG